MGDLQAPHVGKWSDAYGRQPFLLLTFVCASFPVLVLYFNLNYGLSMYFYFPAQVRNLLPPTISLVSWVDTCQGLSAVLPQALNGALSSMSICMAYIADLLHPDHRAPAFGLILCSFSVGILVGPAGGGYIQPKMASVLAPAGLLGCILYIALLIPESTTRESRLAVRPCLSSLVQHEMEAWK